MKARERYILAQQINREHRLCVAAVCSCVEHAIYAGEMLAEAKGRTARGGWGAWLEQNFDGSKETARAYMRVARDRGVLEANPQYTANMSLGEMLLYIGEGIQAKRGRELVVARPFKDRRTYPPH